MFIGAPLTIPANDAIASGSDRARALLLLRLSRP
jgi:hypothetical protein